MHFTNAIAQDMAAVVRDAVDFGATAALLRVYDENGAGIPADSDVAITTQLLLAELPLNDPAFTGPTDGSPGGVLTLDVTPIPFDDDANATGVADFARIVTSAGASRIQFDTVSVTGGGGELELNSINIQLHCRVEATGAGTITIPES